MPDQDGAPDYVAREIRGYDTDCRVIVALAKGKADAMTEEELAAWDAERLREFEAERRQERRLEAVPDADEYVTRVYVEGDRRMIAVGKKEAFDRVSDEQLFSDLKAWSKEQRRHLRSVEDPDEG